MPGGYYYLCAITDSGGVVAETNEANNTKCTTGTYKIGPDLLVYAISSSLSGSTVYVNDTEMNSGSQPASGFTVSFYLSADTAYDSGDYSLGSSRDVSGLAGGNATNSKTTSIPIPSGPPAGNYYIIAVTDSDNVIIETNETNNIKVSSGTVTVP
jgi:subtilase family serine protease